MDFKLMKQNKRCEYNTRNSSINKKIKEAVDANAEAMTMEVSSHGLALGRLRGVEFDVAIFSNLTQDHLDFHGTMEAYGHAKSLLFSQLAKICLKKNMLY